MNFGTLNKIIVEFSEKFWDDKDVIRIINDPVSNYSWIVNYYKIIKKNVLIFLTSDETIENKNIDDIKEEVKSFLTINFQGKNISITNINITKWGSDPFSYGSYSSFKVGAIPEHIDSLAKPEGNGLFFFCW